MYHCAKKIAEKRGHQLCFVNYKMSSTMVCCKMLSNIVCCQACKQINHEKNKSTNNTVTKFDRTYKT